MLMNRFLKLVVVPFLALVLIAFLVAFIYIYQERSFVSLDDESFEHEKIITSANDEIHIGIIGDSWVAGNKLDQHIVDHLSINNISATVKSAGFLGHKSKEILELHDVDGDFRNILLDQSIEYIVLIAGVNDTSGHIGKDYYVHHMTELINLIQEYDKTPLILELPEYGVEEDKPLKSSVKHGLYRYLFDDGEKDVITKYRTHLNDTVDSDLYELIPFDDFVNDFHENKNLYKDNFHLNDKGNELLGIHIADFIYDLHNN